MSGGNIMIRNYDKLIFELSKEGRTGYSLPKNVFKEKYSLCSFGFYGGGDMMFALVGRGSTDDFRRKQSIIL